LRCGPGGAAQWQIAAPAPPERLLTRAFVVVTASALGYFIALGIVTPVLPRYVRDDLGGGGTAVGIAVGAFAVTAALFRPLAGRIGDRYGRRVLVLGGAGIAGVSLLGYGLGHNLAVLVLMRLVTGVGEAAMFVGAATTAQDLTPPTRRGEATSYFSIAVYGGLAIGPVLGEALRTSQGSQAVWFAAAAACGAACLLALLMPAGRTFETAAPTRRGLLQRDAIRPGIVLALAMTGYAGFAAFVPLYVDRVGLHGAGGVFATYAVVVLAIRIIGARIPDRFGAVATSTVALVTLAAGLFTMAASPTAAGLYAGTVIFSCGQSLVYPSLFPLVIDRAPESERSHAVATFTLFFDLAQGAGAFALGVVVHFAGERGAFVAAGLVAVVGVVVLRRTAHALTGDALHEDLGRHRAAEGAVVAVDPQDERPIEGVLLADLDPSPGT
jgi:MFS family permease